MPLTLPKITIVTPVFNGGATLRETIQSIIEQEYPDLEYIVVDGGSTDDTLDIVREHAAYVTRLIQGKDRTLYDAVAKGFDAATGDVIAWLNSDDLYVPGILRRIGELFARHPDWQVIFGDDAVWKQNWLVANRPQRPVGMAELLAGKVLPQASTFFRLDAYKAVGGLERENLKLAGDYQLWLRFSALYDLHFLPEQASVFRIRPRQLSGDWNKYATEMQAVAQGAHAHLPPAFSVRTLPGRIKRALLARGQHRKFFYPLDNETLNWPYVEPPPGQPLSACRCLVCNGYPHRLLFSTPDTRFGDRRIWSIYFCQRCEMAFRFPAVTREVLCEICNRPQASDFVDLPEVPPGVYSPFRIDRPLRDRLHYTVLGGVRAGERADFDAGQLVVPTPHKSDTILAVDAWSNRTHQHLREHGFSNIVAEDIGSLQTSGAPVDAILLGQSLQHAPRPIEILRLLALRLKPGGDIYLSLPNLDSAFLDRYGPCWSQWHAPFHAFTLGAKGLRKLAESAGFRVKWTQTNSPPRWIYLSEQIATRGLYTHVLEDPRRLNAPDYRASVGAARAAKLLHNWRGRGDCLHACLTVA